MSTRQAVLVRTFGILHLCFAFYGVSLLVWMNGSSWLARGAPVLPTSPSALPAYLIMTGFNVVFLVGLTYTGVRLLGSKPDGFALNNWLFLAIIAYEAVLLFGLRAGPVGRSVAAAYGIGNVAITPCVLSGYPIVALIGLNLLKKKAGFPAPQDPPQSERRD